VTYRCVGEGTHQKVEAFPAYAAVALAGLGDLPDTVMTRSVVIRMRRRAPSEHVEPYRERIHGPQGDALCAQLAEWADSVSDKLTGAFPTLPAGVTDRPADVWEPLLAIADAAGGDWPQRARAACIALVREAQSVDSGSLGIRLLADLRNRVFAILDEDGKPTGEHHGCLATETVLATLHEIEDAPWGAVGKQRKPLDARGLAHRLKPHGITSTNVRPHGGNQAKGYEYKALVDVFSRYLPAAPAESPSPPSHRPPEDPQRRSSHLVGGTDEEAPTRPGTDTAVPANGNVPSHTPTDVHRDGWDGWDASTREEASIDRWMVSGEPLLPPTGTEKPRSAPTAG
jgi:hypothetical protein